MTRTDWRLVRPLNLGIIAGTALLVAYGMFGGEADGGTELVAHWQVWLFALSFVSIGAAGYIWNDLHDVETDRINRPERAMVQGRITPKAATRLGLMWAIFGLVAAILAGFEFFGIPFIFVYLFYAGLLYAYAVRLKCTVLLGNLIVSLLCALVVPAGFSAGAQILGNGADSAAYDHWFPVMVGYTVFAFFTTLLREMVKDLEDLPGDRATNCGTLPVRTSETTARIASAVLASLLTVSLAALSSVLLIGVLFTGNIPGLLCAAGGIVLSLVLTIRLWRARLRADYHSVSKLVKLLMLVGLLFLFFLMVFDK